MSAMPAVRRSNSWLAAPCPRAEPAAVSSSAAVTIWKRRWKCLWVIVSASRLLPMGSRRQLAAARLGKDLSIPENHFTAADCHDGPTGQFPSGEDREVS